MNSKVKNDPLFYGIVAGIVGGIFQIILSVPFVYFNIIDSGVLEHAMLIITSQNLVGFLPAVVGFTAHMVNSGLWGGIYGVLINIYPSHRYLKGAGIGLLSWIIVMSYTTLIGKHTGGQEEALHSILLLMFAAIAGLVTALVYRLLTKRFD